MEKVFNDLNEQELKAKIIEEKKTAEKVQNIIEEQENNNKKQKNEEEYLDNKSTKIKQTSGNFRKKWIIIVSAIIVLLALLSTIFALINVNNDKIIAGVKIDGINMKGLTREEAKDILNKKIQEKLNKEIKIKIDDYEEQSLLLSQIELEYDVENIIELAYKIGRKGNIFVNNFEILQSMLLGNNINLNALYNKEILDNVVKDIKSKIPNVVKEADFCIEDDKLIITKGIPGLTIDEEDIKQKIEETMNLSKGNSISINTFSTKPKDINIEEIYKEVHTEAKDAYYTKNPFQIFPEVLGIDFDIEEAKEIIKEEKDEYIIPLKITKPNKTVKNIGTEAFPDLISTFSTRYDASNTPRTTNLKLAVEKINGAVVMPGEVFSYNKTVGKRTAEAGYKDAAGYQGGKVVQMIGGGICQISSTLYDAAVYANLEIVERHNHAFTTSYVGAGKDATVVYGALDFKFKNTRNYPITIKASAQNGIAKIDIYGVKEENEYQIEISTSILNYIPYSVVYENDSRYDEGYEKVTQYGSQGCKSVTYKIYKQNGIEVSRKVLSTDTYDAMNKYITRGTRKTTPVVTEPVTPAEPNEPSVPEEPVTPEEPTQPEEPVTPPEPTEPTDPEEPIVEEPAA